MSIEVFDVQFKDENNELKPEGVILSEYLNVLARKCRKTTRGKTYDELEEGESFDRFQNRLGFFTLSQIVNAGAMLDVEFEQIGVFDIYEDFDLRR